MTDNETLKSILDIVRACDSVILATNDGVYPDVRHMSNEMNRNARDLTLYLMTGRNTPKATQLRSNLKCCLYYFNPQNRHVVRLFGDMEFVDDATVRGKYWNNDFIRFGYHGPADPNFLLMRFNARAYKFYAGDKLNRGAI